MKKIIMATNNKGKIEELSKMLDGFEVLSQKEAGIDINPEENGNTFLVILDSGFSEEVNNNYYRR